MQVLVVYILAGIGERACRAVVTGTLVAVITLLAGVLLFAPAVVGFAIAAACAVAWCIWLERHPEVDDADGS